MGRTHFEFKKTVSFCLVLSFFLLLVAEPYALADYSGMTIVSGEVTVDTTSQPGATIFNASDHAIVDFDSFNVNLNDRYIINSPSFLANVKGNSFSDISGSLVSYGQFILTNPNGINVRSTGRIEGSVILSTLGIQQAMYANNQLVFEKIEGSKRGSILNEGVMLAPNGNIALLSESIENKGTISAEMGSVVLGSGEMATLSFDGQGLINLTVNRGTATTLGNGKAAIENTGTEAQKAEISGKRVYFSAKTFSDTVETLVNQAGIVRAIGAVEKDGKVEFVSNGAILNPGTIEANLFIEHGYTFRTTGALRGGQAFFDNLDGAGTISGAIGSDISDTGDLYVTGAVTFDASPTSFRFIADSDQNASGRFWMQSGTSITGTGQNLTIITSSTNNGTAGSPPLTSELYGISGLGNLILTSSTSLSTSAPPPTFTAKADLSITGTLTLGAVTGTPNANGVASLAMGANNLTAGALTITKHGGSPNLISFDGGSGTTTINGNVTVNTGTFTPSSLSTAITGNLSNSGTWASSTGAVTVGGNFTNNSSSSFTSTSGILSIGGNFSNSGTFTHNNGTVKFTATDTDNTIGGSPTPSAPSFYNLTMDGVGGKWTLGNNTTVANALAVTNGTLDINGKSLTVSGSAGNTSIGSGGTIRLQGGETITGLSLGSNSGIVEYYGTSSYTGLKLGNSYNDLSFTGSGGVWTLNSLLEVGSVTIGSGATLSANGQTIETTGNWANSGTFTHGNGLVNFLAPNATSRTVTTGGSHFYDVTFGGSGGTASLQDTFYADRNIVIAAGHLALNDKTLYAGGSWANNSASGFLDAGTGKVVFTATDTDNTIDVGTTGENASAFYAFYDLEFNGVGGTWDLTGHNLIATHSLQITNGTFDLNGKNLTTTGATFENLGTFRLKGDETITGLTIDINSGTTEFDGAGSYSYTIPNWGQTYYDLKFSGAGSWNLGTATFNVNRNFTITGGTVSTSNNNILNVKGNWLNSGGTFNSSIGGIVNLDGASAGQITSGGSAFYDLRLKNSGTWTLQDAFQANHDFQIDAGSTLNANGKSMTMQRHWYNYGTFNGQANTTTFTSSQNQFLYNYNGSSAAFGNLVINNSGTSGLSDKIEVGGALDVDGNLTVTDGVLDLATNSSSLDLEGDLSIDSGGYMNWGSTTHNMAGNVTFAGGYSASSGTWIFDGAGTQLWTLNNSYPVNNSVSHSGAGTLKISDNLSVSNSRMFSNSAGTFDANGHNVTVAGLATLSGGNYTAGTGTHDFSSGLTINGGTFTGGSNDVNVLGNLTLSSGTLILPSEEFNVSGNWVRSGGVFTTGTNRVTFNGTSQTISGSNTFYELRKVETSNNSTDTTLIFTAGTTQTVNGALILDGLDDDDRINLRSSAFGSKWNLVVNGTVNVDFVDVQDSDASGGQRIQNTQSINGGNNQNWFVNSAPLLPQLTQNAANQAIQANLPPVHNNIQMGQQPLPANLNGFRRPQVYAGDSSRLRPDVGGGSLDSLGSVLNFTGIHRAQNATFDNGVVQFS